MRRDFIVNNTNEQVSPYDRKREIKQSASSYQRMNQIFQKKYKSKYEQSQMMKMISATNLDVQGVA